MVLIFLLISSRKKKYLIAFSSNRLINHPAAPSPTAHGRYSTRIHQPSPTKHLPLGQGGHLGHQTVSGGLGAQATEGTL